MLYGFNANQDNDNKFHQRVADQNIQGLESRQEEIQHAKNGFLTMLAGIFVGGVLGWFIFGSTEQLNKEKVIPVVRRSITPAKVLPNDPGGMEIDNQNREIYHIVENKEKTVEEVNIVPEPDMPQLVIEKNIDAPENIENLVESLEEDNSLNEIETVFGTQNEKNIKVANSNLAAVNTNSKDKITIPAKIKEIDVKLQKSINTENANTVKESEKKNIVETPVTKSTSQKMAKGTWYTQIIASSSRKTVEKLWNELITKHAFLRSYPHEVEEITAAKGNTLYRLKVGTFKTRPEAEALSNKLKQNQISSIIKQN